LSLRNSGRPRTLPPQSSVHVISVRKVPLLVDLRNWRVRMQRCSLVRKNRKRGPDVWLLRWSDKSDSGRRIYRKRVIGTVEEFVDADSACRAVASLIGKINGDTISTLCSHFERCELAQGNTWRSYSTKKCYAGYLNRWIIPQWGKYELGNIKTIEGESWLRRLPLAKGSCYCGLCNVQPSGGAGE
jgi:hypothetical protein